MSEWTSMPAAWGWRTVRTGVGPRGGPGGRGPAFARVAFSRRRLCRLMASATVWGWGTAGVSREGDGGAQFPQRDRRGVAAAGHQWQGRRLPGQVAWRARAHQCRVGRGRTPVDPAYQTHVHGSSGAAGGAGVAWILQAAAPRIAGVRRAG